MDKEIKKFINLIKEKTGLCVEECETSPCLESGEAFRTDTANNKVYFAVKSRLKSYNLVLEGSGKAEENYAKLIIGLAENYFFSDTELSRAEFFKSALYGELKAVQIERYMSKFALPESPCFVMIITGEKEVDGVDDVILGYGENQSDFLIETEKGRFALVKFVDENSRDYRSSREYAEYLVQSVYDETGENLNVAIGGTVDSVAEVYKSYSQAFSAFNMAKTISLRGRVHCYNEYMFFKILEDLPKHKTGEYLDILYTPSAKEIFEDKELLETAEEFLENSLNISETARRLYLHRNTLSYRLEKIEKGTGLDIRKFSDAVTFRIMWALSVFLNK